MQNIETRDIIVWVILGILAGAIADLFVPGSGNILGYLVAGLIGSFLGGYLARRFNVRLNIGSPFIEQMIVSVAGAIIVLVIARIIF